MHGVSSVGLQPTRVIAACAVQQNTPGDPSARPSYTLRGVVLGAQTLAKATEVRCRSSRFGRLARAAFSSLASTFPPGAMHSTRMAL